VTGTADGPELAAAKQLLALVEDQGFTLQQVALGEDRPLFARRETVEYRDEIYLGGFAEHCHATRARKSSAGARSAGHRTRRWGHPDGAAHGGI
jgi:hypothetical protein